MQTACQHIAPGERAGFPTPPPLRARRLSSAVHEISSVCPRAFFAMSEVFRSRLVSTAVW